MQDSPAGSFHQKHPSSSNQQTPATPAAAQHSNGCPLNKVQLRLDDVAAGVESHLAPQAHANDQKGADGVAEGGSKASTDMQPSLSDLLASLSKLYRSVGAPISLGEILFGIPAVSQAHASQPLQAGDELQGEEVTDVEELRSLVDDLDMAQACYKRSVHAAAAYCAIKVQDISVWQAEGSYLRPGYWIGVDHRTKRVVWSIRGTRYMVDLLTDLCSIHPVTQGHTHWGIHQAALWLVDQEGERVAGLLRQHPTYTLHLVGHSLGGGIGGLIAHLAHNDARVRSLLMPPAAHFRHDPGRHLGVTATCFASPCTMSKELADSCRPYVKSVMLGEDLVPRLNADSLASLQAELKEVDWRGQLQRSIEEHKYVQSLRAALRNAGSSLAPRLQQVTKETSLSAALDNIIATSKHRVASSLPSAPSSLAPLMERLDTYQASGLSPIQAVERMLADAGKMTSSWSAWWLPKDQQPPQSAAAETTMPPLNNPPTMQQQQQAQAGPLPHERQQEQQQQQSEQQPAAQGPLGPPGPEQKEPDLAGWFQGAASVAARAQQGLADLVALAEKHWVPPAVRASLLEVLSAKREGQKQDSGVRGYDQGPGTIGEETMHVAREAGTIEGDAHSAAQVSGMREEDTNRAAQAAAVAAAQMAGIPRTAPALDVLKQQHATHHASASAATSTPASSTCPIASGPPHAPLVDTSAAAPTDTVANSTSDTSAAAATNTITNGTSDTSPAATTASTTGLPPHVAAAADAAGVHDQTQNKLAALTSSVADVARAAAVFDLAGVVKGIKALGAVAEVEAAISAAATTATTFDQAGSKEEQETSAFFMMYPAGQWYHIRRRRNPPQRSYAAPEAAGSQQPDTATQSTEIQTSPSHLSAYVRDDVPEDVYGPFGTSSRARAKGGQSREKGAGPDAGPAGVQVDTSSTAATGSVGVQQGSGERRKAPRMPYMVVRAAPDAPFFFRARFTRAALRDHRCRSHRAGLLSAIAQDYR